MDHPSTRTSRTLSEKGLEHYKQLNQEFVVKVDKIKDQLQEAVRAKDLDKINIFFVEYNNISHDYMAFLRSYKCEEADKRLSTYLEQFELNKAGVLKLKEQLLQSTQKKEEDDNQSVSSSVGSISSLKAKLASAEARREIIIQEGQLDIEKSKFDAEKSRFDAEYAAKKQFFKAQSDVAQARAELNAAQEELLGVPSQEQFMEHSAPLIMSNLRLHDSSQPLQNVPASQPPIFSTAPISSGLFQSHPFQNIGSTPPRNPFNNTSDIAKLLFRKDLLFSRLQTFDEKAHHFSLWKTNFLSVVREMELSDSEQLDMLIKHLGPDSKSYGLDVQAANPGNPARALETLWERLHNRFGAPEFILQQIKGRIDSFPNLTLKNARKLYDLCDILDQISTLKTNPEFALHLCKYDTSEGVNQILPKLPYQIKYKWLSKASKIVSQQAILYPPFSKFVEFVKEQTTAYNNPAFPFDGISKGDNKQNSTLDNKKGIRTFKTQVDKDPEIPCLIHKKDNHTLVDCNSFKRLPRKEKIKVLTKGDPRICWNCLGTEKHNVKLCKPQCQKCKRRHHTAMHFDIIDTSNSKHDLLEDGSNSENKDRRDNTDTDVKTTCTKVCKDPLSISKNCGKIIPVKIVYKTKSKVVYALIDDQSNRSLVAAELLDFFKINSKKESYNLTSCSGQTQLSGRKASGLKMSSLNGDITFGLPTLIECDSIPQDRSEIPTQDVAFSYKHLKDIAKQIPKLINHAPISILIGRDVPNAHYVLDQKIGAPNQPFAQKLPLGWVVIGETCNHANNSSVKCNKLFVKTLEDEEKGLSMDDYDFLSLMNKDFKMNESGRWSVGLPFRTGKEPVISNRSQALHRANILHKNLLKNEIKRKHFLQFMQKIIDKNATEVAPPLGPNEKSYYLPLFGVYHPKKPDKIRGVFDSSAKFNDESLNDKLLSGPDFTNSLLGIILRFRQDEFPITADIECMFYQFFVDEKDRNFLRFFWYKDNCFENPLIEYRMTVHVFGNSPSPAIATYGLRKAVNNCQTSIKDFVNESFYIDDGVKSMNDREKTIELMKDTQKALHENGGIRLHKIASSDRQILESFDKSELHDSLTNIDISKDTLPVHSCLGLEWDLNTDCFILQCSIPETPFSRRGLLSILNSIYDPIGFLSPVTIAGKIILREISPNGKDWDTPLSEEHRAVWDSWKKSVESLQKRQLPRMYLPESLSLSKNVSYHVFCDASEKAISAVVYVKSKSNISFVLGKSKVAPSSGHSIPRLELCSALLAVELWEIVSKQLDVSNAEVKFYSDSKVVLGYISNSAKRFHVYVSNRVFRIRQVSSPDQWHYVPTDLNPADTATRQSVTDHRLNVWLTGPELTFLDQEKKAETFPLISPGEDKEVKVLKLTVSENSFSQIFLLFVSWFSLVRALCFWKHLARSFFAPVNDCKGWHKCSSYLDPQLLTEVEMTIIRFAQREVFSDEIQTLSIGKELPKDSSIISLSPFLDNDGMLRVGGRVNANRISDDKNPIIVPKGHVARLLVLYFHKKVKHQGRHFTEGIIRSSGFWIVGAKRLVSSVINDCFICRILRRKPCAQKMADLPADRVNPPIAPFSNVGIDCFGPYSIVTRRTRGGAANSKRWAVLFTCLSVRAIHIELIEELTTSSFINAFKRFTSLRGPVKLIRSDQGTNFVGASKLLDVKWIFNPPHSSHMGGVWERMIGVSKRILDFLLRDHRRKALTFEVLSTFMAEVCHIVNNRPITAVTHDPSNATLLTPATLLHMKFDSKTQNCINSNNAQDAYKAHYIHVQSLSSCFWDRWSVEYMDTLEKRSKWHKQHPNVEVGHIVLLRDKSLPRYEWCVCVVTKIFPSEDKLVRSCEIKLLNKDNVFYVRPIAELISLH